MKLLELLELLELATYEVIGGRNLEIFVRLNDPLKISRIAQNQSNNSLLREIVRRHKEAQSIMAAFLQKPLDTPARWDLIEDYFLGHEDVVRSALGLKDTADDS